MTLDWGAAALFLRGDPAWRSKLFVAGLWLLVPIVGWPIVLGYRRAVVRGLWRGTTPLLPEWRGNCAAFLRSGLEAAAVIHAHFAPLYLWIAYRALTSTGLDETPWQILLGIAFVFPIFSTLAIPASLFLLGNGALSPGLGDLEAAMIAGLYASLTFYIPSGFLRVSQTERITSAFCVGENLRLIARRFRLYCEAWLCSGLLSLIGHGLVPLAPWGVPWCYLGIVYTFNEVLAVSGEKEPRASHFVASPEAGDG